MKRSIVCGLIILLLSSMVALGDTSLPTAAKRSRGIDLGLLDPVRNMLSGRAWLMTEGLDPGLRRRPGWDTLTRLDWQKLEDGLSAALSSSAPTMQAAGGFLVPYRSPAPAFSRDILISRDFSSMPIQTEPHVAVNPEDSDHVVVAMIDYNFPSTTSYVTFDGGVRWEGPFQSGYLPDDRVSGGDPVLAFDKEGKVYQASISIGVEEFSVGPMYTSTMVSSIAVARSDDGGMSWPSITSADRSSVVLSEQQIDGSGRLRGSVAIGFLDKPWMTVGRHPTDPSRDVVYLTYVEFEVFYQIMYSGELPLLLPREMSSTVRLVRSEDRAVTWSDPVAVGPTVRRVFGEMDSVPDAPGMFGSDRVVQGPRPVVDKNGVIYVAWIDSTDDGSMKGLGEIHTATSSDGGKTFSSPTIATAFNEIPFRPRNAYFRYWASAFPKLSIGPEGNLYLVYTGRPSEKPKDDGDIYLIRSTDRARTWSSPVRLNDDEGSSLQFFPEVDVDPEGTIHVMWGDMRDDPIQTRYHIYYTQSKDAGRTWGFDLPELGIRDRDTRVTDFASNPNRAFPYGLFIGDYFSLAAAGEDVYMVWADSRLAEYGGVNQKIAFARRRAIRQPDIYVSPSAGAGGQSITIQGFNFQPDMNAMIQLQDAVIATARTNHEGRFTTGIYIPITGEGPQTIRVFDESGNMASTSFYTEFGFDNIEQLYTDLLEQMQELNRNLESRQ